MEALIASSVMLMPTAFALLLQPLISLALRSAKPQPAGCSSCVAKPSVTNPELGDSHPSVEKPGSPFLLKQVLYSVFNCLCEFLTQINIYITAFNPLTITE